ncbi:hypothetical protein BGZ54_008192, partial [Gamsiella multidivaricata]
MNDRHYKPTHCTVAHPVCPERSHGSKSTEEMRSLTQTRVYGVYISLYAWSLWCCDHYRVDLVVSFGFILTGAFLLWHTFPSPSDSLCAGSAVAEETLMGDDAALSPVLPDGEQITVVSAISTNSMKSATATIGGLSQDTRHAGPM